MKEYQSQTVSQRARENEARFHILAKMLPVGIYHTDAQGLCIYPEPSDSGLRQ